MPGRGSYHVRPHVAIAMTLTLLVGASTGQCGWKMRVHEGGAAAEYSVSDVDSVTFYFLPGPDMNLVGAGAFVMGDGVANCGVDEREVTLTRDFYMGEHEVTNQEYKDGVQWAYDHGYVTATAAEVRDNLDGSTQLLLDLSSANCEIQFDSGTETFYLRESPSSQAQGAYPDGYDPADHPVKMVTWYGAARYCDWVSLQVGVPRAYAHSGDWSCNNNNPYGASGYRLPTDAEWEYAAQYNDDRTYPWGFQAPDCSRVNYNYCIGWTCPAGSYPPAPASLGLSDMAGQVWEWCNDWWACNLGTAAVTDPIGQTTGTWRAIRGGAWLGGESGVRCAGRYSGGPGDRYWHFGFRVARTANP